MAGVQPGKRQGFQGERGGSERSQDRHTARSRRYDQKDRAQHLEHADCACSAARKRAHLLRDLVELGHFVCPSPEVEQRERGLEDPQEDVHRLETPLQSAPLRGGEATGASGNSITWRWSALQALSAQSSRDQPPECESWWRPRAASDTKEQTEEGGPRSEQPRREGGFPARAPHSGADGRLA